MNRFEALRPHNWSESIDETLDAIHHEAEHHTTEMAVVDLVTSDGFFGTQHEDDVNTAVSKLRARAVVLAQEVERLQAEQTRLVKQLHRAGVGAYTDGAWR